jgi:hypothetical protein
LPPLIALAVKVTLSFKQMLLLVATNVTAGVSNSFTVMMLTLEVAGLLLTLLSLEVNTT